MFFLESSLTTTSLFVTKFWGVVAPCYFSSKSGHFLKPPQTPFLLTLGLYWASFLPVDKQSDRSSGSVC